MKTIKNYARSLKEYMNQFFFSNLISLNNNKNLFDLYYYIKMNHNENTTELLEKIDQYEGENVELKLIVEKLEKTIED